MRPDPADAAEIVRMLRRDMELSQRELGARAGTSGPTIAAYESGAKEPRLSTLQRLAEVGERRLQVHVVSVAKGTEQRIRRERRSLALAAAIADVVARDYPAARRLATENLDLSESIVGDNRAKAWIDEWRRILDRGPAAVRRALVDPSPHGHDLRQMTPFAGLLTDDERQAAYAAADAFDLLATVR